jgi:hypothetical protein
VYARWQARAETLGQACCDGIALGNDVHVRRMRLQRLEQPGQKRNVVGPFLLGRVKRRECPFYSGEVSAGGFVFGRIF